MRCQRPVKSTTSCGPERAQDRDLLLDARRPRFVKLIAERLVLDRVPADPDTEA